MLWSCTAHLSTTWGAPSHLAYVLQPPLQSLIPYTPAMTTTLLYTCNDHNTFGIKPSWKHQTCWEDHSFHGSKSIVHLLLNLDSPASVIYQDSTSSALALAGLKHHLGRKESPCSYPEPKRAFYLA